MSVGLIGFGRFGRILAMILTRAFQVKVYDPVKNDKTPGVEFVDLKTVIQEKVIFIAVPINSFRSVIEDIAPDLEDGTTIIDVCSVKKYPVKVMQDLLNAKIDIIATHPLFGPDSFLSNSHLKMVMYNVRDMEKRFKFWQRFFKDQGIQILEISPDDHDRMAAQTQGVTHFLGRMLKEFGIKKTRIDTQGFQDLIDLVDQTCNDTWELYTDLQNYNPYTEAMVQKIKSATGSLATRLKGNSNEFMEN